MAELQELFTKVTGLTWDIASVKDEKTDEELAWLIPDGAMLDDPECQKAKDTKELLGMLGLSEDTKFSEVEVEEGDDSSDNGSSDNGSTDNPPVNPVTPTNPDDNSSYDDEDPTNQDSSSDTSNDNG